MKITEEIMLINYVVIQIVRLVLEQHKMIVYLVQIQINT